MSDPLASLWKRADLKDHVFCAEDLSTWPGGLQKALETTKVLRRVEDAEAVICEDCGEPHSAEVVRDTRRAASPYYRCPEIGRVPLKAERLHRWIIDFDRLAIFLNGSLSLSGNVTDVVSGRVWLLGRLSPTPDAGEVFLFRGIWWADACDVLERSVRLAQSSRAVVLVARRFPPAQTWANQRAALVALAEIVELDRSGLRVPRDAVLAASSRSSAQADAPSRTQPAVMKVSRSIGSPAAVKTLLALKDKKGWTMEELARHLGTTARTAQSFVTRGTVRNSVFRTMAERLEVTPADLLAGKMSTDK